MAPTRECILALNSSFQRLYIDGARHPWKWGVDSLATDSEKTQKDSSWNMSTASPVSERRSKFASILPMPSESIEIDHVRVDGGRHPFLCALLAGNRRLDIPFGIKMTLIHFVFDRLEQACYDFTKRHLPWTFELMCLESHDEIDIEAWAQLLYDHRYRLCGYTDGQPQNAVDDNNRLGYCALAHNLRNTAVHLRDYSMNLIKHCVAWMSYLKDKGCLDETQSVLKVIYYNQGVAEGIQEPRCEISQEDQLSYAKAMNPPCLTKHKLLNMTAKALQRACFNFWRKHKPAHQYSTWMCPDHIELQEWHYEHRWLLGQSLANGAERDHLYHLLEEAKN